MQDFAQAKVFDQIPIIDVAPLLTGQGAQSVAAQIYDAATEVGFFYISGHGIAQDVIDQAFRVTADFFALPEAQKSTAAVNQHQRGWMAQGMSRLSGSKTHDLKEVFFWGAETALDDPDLLAAKPLVAANQWPDAVFPRLRTDITPYYDAVCDVAQQIMSALALSLDQPRDLFTPAYQKPLARGQLVYYPPSTDEDEAEERFGVAPHTDFGVLTFLLQDNSGGLQVCLRSGEWVAAPPIPGTLVCNIGDLLQRWSNDRFRSTLHRVINRSKGARYSIPIFFDPQSDCVVDPKDLGVPENQSKYEPITAGAYIMGRNKQSFSQYKDDP
ncbi:MAG: 2-oxoglutarate and iron-dependent oxygenase domain-containing protein [Paracoccaceae bacterium]